ncbi:brachyurin-like [Spodoptera litura]|uniref:Brachyurin-like n=1 Tax=Spodoptera litura TaxID=69820 RepID=A0A9J7EEM0_SPOLT|nr:brachyurin-like [Spodoptera litura]
MKLLAVTLLALAVAASAKHITLEDVIQLEKNTPEIAIASGFGINPGNGGVIPNQPLSYVDLPVISNDECEQDYGSIILPGIICTGSVVGKNICTGDSGGPLAGPVVIGVVSFRRGGACDGGSPAGYARVTHYVDWINEHL